MKSDVALILGAVMVAGGVMFDMGRRTRFAQLSGAIDDAIVANPQLF